MKRCAAILWVRRRGYHKDTKKRGVRATEITEATEAEDPQILRIAQINDDAAIYHKAQRHEGIEPQIARASGGGPIEQERVER